jgi:DNA transformation protein and related proteins
MAHPAFVELCLELLAPLGAVRAQCMFGGYGLYAGELFVALVADDRLYLKVDDRTQPAFEAAGCQPFVYAGRGRQVTMSFWTPPDEAMDAPQAMLPWARRAQEAASRARTARGQPASARARAGAAAAASAAEAAAHRPRRRAAPR